MAWSYNATGVGLMVFALAILIIGGITYNNLTASGFSNPLSVYDQNGTCLTLNCPAFGQTNNAPILPCQVSAHCKLSTPSFLNPNSPFTYLFGGDLSGFISSFSNGGSSPSLNALSICTTNAAGTSFTFLHCTSSAWNIEGPPYQQYPIVSCNLRNPATALSNGFNATTNAAPYSTPSISNLSQWTIVGCVPTDNIHTTPFNQSAAVQILADYAGPNGSITLTRFRPGLVDLFGSSQNAINFLTFFGFIVGIILFVMSFGIGFTASAGAATASAGGGFSSNAQGTRFAQVAGLGLIIWIPFYSEFSPWINSISGFGINVMITFALLITFFIGMWTQTTSGNAGS